MGKSIFLQCLDVLKEHRDRLETTSLAELFDQDLKRVEDFSLRLGSLYFDFSKNRLDKPAFDTLVKLAHKLDIEAKRDAMFSGAAINTTEKRAALHTALRDQFSSQVMVDGADIMAQIRDVHARMAGFCDSVRTGKYRVSGNRVTDIVNLGIGGSDLGPCMVVESLRPYVDGPNVHFVANVDGADLADTLQNLDPRATLFIIASKSFTTQETMINARSALDWAQVSVGESASEHFVAVSANLKATREFGIPDERTFELWDWVGGRYSVWSAIGLPVMMALGVDGFKQFLAGAFVADQHFKDTPLDKNIPVIMALLGIWHRNVYGYINHAVMPYDQRMKHFPRWLQQLDMESNGKSVTGYGQPTDHETGPVIFGEPGTNGQHAFFQLLHQGTTVIPCDFLVAACGHEESYEHNHELLVANCFAQSEALMQGRSVEDVDGNPHRAFEGNRPSNTFLYKTLDPHTLGMLMAFYEHKVFVQGAIWDINSFDQWGVELGKELARPIAEALVSGENSSVENSSTRKLLEEVENLKRQF